MGTLNSFSTNSVEKPFFEIICLILAVVMGYLSVQSYLNIGPTILLVADLGMMFAGFSFFYLSYKLDLFHIVRYPFIVFVYSGITFFWFWLNGISGTTPFALIAGSVVAILITEKKYRKTLTGITLTWILALVYIQRKTDWIYKRFHGEELVSNNFVIFSFAIIIILHFIKSRYDIERRRANEKKEELEKLNETLTFTLGEKEEIIRQLRKTREELLESEKLASLGKLTSGLAHELNNPLNYIGGVVTPLKNDVEELLSLVSKSQKDNANELKKEIDSLLDTLESGTNKAAGVIKSLVKISPLQRPQVEEVFSVAKILEDNLTVLRKTHASVRFDVDLDYTLTIKGNPFELQQVFLQVLQNCIYSVSATKDKRISIHLKKMDKSMVIHFTDNGTGIPKENVEKVFDPFYTTAKSGERKGLGMYMSYVTIKKHFGQIKIESEPEIGTTISIFLPLA
jgi:C4-dicarboxylate-specific signal transduction histidine kinase